MGDDDEKMGDASLPPLTFGAAGASGDWAADVEHEHEASGRNADVLELEREKARKRAERFGQAFKEPSKKTLAGAHGLLSRKEVLAVRKERAMKKAARGGQFVTGIDLFDPEEEAKRAARAAKFGAMLDAAPEQRALAERRSAERAARDAASAPAGDADASMDAGAEAQDTLEDRVDPELDAVWRNDAVHLYGVDHMTTNDCVGYFGEYGPVFCEWINDSSCNVVFADEVTARRAIRMKGTAMGAAANPDEKGALPEGLEAEMLWHSGPEFYKDGKTLQLSFRLATEDDIKPHGKIKSRYLWLSGKGGKGKRRRGGGGGDRGGDRRGGKRRRGGGGGRMRASTTMTRAWAIYAINSSAPARKRRRRAKRRDRRVATVTRRCASTTPARTPWTRRTRTRRQRRPIAGVKVETGVMAAALMPPRRRARRSPGLPPRRRPWRRPICDRNSAVTATATSRWSDSDARAREGDEISAVTQYLRGRALLSSFLDASILTTATLRSTPRRAHSISSAFV